jgi:hypothetical protein
MRVGLQKSRHQFRKPMAALFYYRDDQEVPDIPGEQPQSIIIL